MSRKKWAVRGRGRATGIPLPRPDDGWGNLPVIKQWWIRRKSFIPNEFLGVKAPLRIPMLDVTLRRNVTDWIIKWHVIPVLRDCSFGPLSCDHLAQTFARDQCRHAAPGGQKGGEGLARGRISGAFGPMPHSAAWRAYRLQVQQTVER